MVQDNMLVHKWDSLDGKLQSRGIIVRGGGPLDLVDKDMIVFSCVCKLYFWMKDQMIQSQCCIGWMMSKVRVRVRIGLGIGFSRLGLGLGPG